jgi:hypothetical protein
MRFYELLKRLWIPGLVLWVLDFFMYVVPAAQGKHKDLHTGPTLLLFAIGLSLIVVALWAVAAMWNRRTNGAVARVAYQVYWWGGAGYLGYKAVKGAVHLVRDKA